MHAVYAHNTGDDVPTLTMFSLRQNVPGTFRHRGGIEATAFPFKRPVTCCTGAKGPISLHHRACEETCLAGVQAHFDAALGRACRVKRTRYIAHKTKRRVHAAGRQLSNAYTQGYATVS